MKKIRNRILYCFYLIGVVVLLTELGSPIALRLAGKTFDKQALQSELRGMAGEHMPDSISKEYNNPIFPHRFIRDLSLHPYSGFTYTPDKKNSFGFSGSEPLVKRKEDRINICVLGGSVAAQFHQNERFFLNELGQFPAFQNKELNLTSMAVGGYKQPQQLMTLTYLLLLGAEYDLIINLDGFNEIALPYSDNKPGKVYPYYPRLWNLVSTKSPDIEVMRLQVRIHDLKSEQIGLSTFFVRSPFIHSNFFLILWKYLLIKKKEKVKTIYQDLINTQEARLHDPIKQGPFFDYSDSSLLFQDLSEKWAEASVMIHQLSQHHGAQYFHFLQPNQYVKDSKTMGQEEQTVANIHYMDPDVHPISVKYAEAVEMGYPELIQQGESLKGKGVNFTDLSMIYKDEARMVYHDPCCHFNSLGLDIMSQRIAQQIARTYQERDIP